MNVLICLISGRMGDGRTVRTNPLYIFPGGLMTAPSPIKQYLPTDITTCWPAVDLLRSPRSMEEVWMIDLPPKTIFVAPAMRALRDTLSM